MPFIPPDSVNRSAVQVQGKAVIPADFGEYAGAAAEAFLYNDRSISRPMNMAEEYRKVLASYRETTGRDFEYMGKRPGGRGARTNVANVIPQGDEDIASFWSRMDEELAANPDLANVLGARSHQDIMQTVFKRAQMLEAQRDDFAARASGLASLGGIAGEISAVVTDPVIAASMLLAAPAATGVLSGAIIEAGIAGGAEAIVQPAIQKFRAEAGLEAGFGKGIENVAVAATAAAGFYGAFRVGGMGYSALVKGIRGDPEAGIRGTLNYADMTPEERTAMLELEKAALVDDSQPYGRPHPEDLAAHQRRLEEARMALVQGRAVKVRADDATLDLGMETISIRKLAARVRTLESVGLDLEEMVPNLSAFLDLANDQLDIVIARERVDGVVTALRTAVKEERPFLEAVQQAEEALADVTARRSAATAERAKFGDEVRAIIREEGLAGMNPSMRATFDRLEKEYADLPPEASAAERRDLEREMGRLVKAGWQKTQFGLVSEERALAALDDADRAMVKQLEQKAKKTTNQGSAQGFLLDRQRLLDKGRMRVSRAGEARAGEAGRRDAEIQRLTEIEQALNAEYTAALRKREEAGEALLAARRQREEAAGLFNERIGSALSQQELRRVNDDWMVSGQVFGDRPPGAVARTDAAEAEYTDLIARQSGEAARRIEDAQIENLTPEAANALGDLNVIETPDGRMVSAEQAVRELEEERAFLDEFKRCFANANAP
jgi:hypothetical protein